MATNPKPEVIEAAETSASASAATSAAGFIGRGLALGVLAMVGADAYQGIKALFARKRAEKKSEFDLRKEIELDVRRELDGRRSAK